MHQLTKNEIKLKGSLVREEKGFKLYKVLGGYDKVTGKKQHIWCMVNPDESEILQVKTELNLHINESVESNWNLFIIAHNEKSKQA